MENQWDRQPTETLKAFQAFNQYLTTGSIRTDLPPRTSPPSKLDPGPFEVHSKG